MPKFLLFLALLFLSFSLKAQVKKIILPIPPIPIKLDSGQFISNESRQKLADELKSKEKPNNYFKRKFEAVGLRLPDLQKPDSFKLKDVVTNINGRASILQQVGKREGYYPNDDPATFTRFTYQGGVSVLGIPIKASTLLTTEQSKDRQPMNRFNIGLDLQQLKLMNWQNSQEQLKNLEQELDLGKHTNLEELYQFYDQYDLDINNPDYKFNTEELGATLQNQPDSLVNAVKGKAAAKLPELKEQALQNAKEIALKSKGKEKNPKPKKEKTNKARQKKERPHKNGEGKPKEKQEHEFDLAKVKKLQKIRDSLELHAPDWLAKYEQYCALKKAKSGDYGSLKKLTKLSTAEKLLSNVKTFNIGTSYPDYTAYTLKGIPVTGVNVELQPDKFYAAFTANKNLNESLSQGLYKRNIIAGRFGLGATETDHIHFTYLRGFDTKRSVYPDTILTGIQDTVFQRMPYENALVGAEFRKTLIPSLLTAQGELTHSLTSTDSYHNLFPNRELGNYVTKPAFEDKGIHSDRAYNLKLTFTPVENHKLFIKHEHIGTGFYTLGVPFLRNDVALYEIKTEHTLLKNKLKLSPAYSRWHDNLSGKKEGTSFMNVLGLNLKYAPKRLPVTVVNYSRNQIYAPGSYTLANLVNIISAYNYKLRRNSFQTVVSGTHLTKEKEAAENKELDFSRSLAVNQTMTLEVPVTLQASASYLNSRTNQKTNNITSLSGSLSYIYRGHWQSTAGLAYAVGSGNLKKQGQFLETSIRLGKHYSFMLRGEHNIFRGSDLINTIDHNGNFQEWLMQTALSYSF